MAVGHIRGLFILRLCRVVVHQQLPFPLHADAKPQPGQSEQCFALVPPQPRAAAKADHAALGGFPIGLAGLKFGVRAPRLQRRCQPKQQRCHYPTSFPASASRTAFSSASSIAFAVCAGASSSSPLPTVKLCAGASGKAAVHLLRILCQCRLGRRGIPLRTAGHGTLECAAQVHRLILRRVTYTASGRVRFAKVFCLPVGMEKRNASPKARTVSAVCAAPSCPASLHHVHCGIAVQGGGVVLHRARWPAPALSSA